MRQAIKEYPRLFAEFIGTGKYSIFKVYTI